MRRWLVLSIILFAGSWGLLFYMPPSMGGVSPTISVDPTALSDPMRYPWVVGILLLVSAGCYSVSLPGQPRPRQQTNGGATGIIGFLGWFGAAVGVGLFVLGMSNQWTGRFLDLMLISNTVIQGMFLLAGVSFLVIQGRFARSTRLRVPSALLRGLVEYGRLFPVIAAAAWLNTQLFGWLGIEPGIPQSLMLFGAVETTADWMMLALLIVVLAPVCEELFFRGVFYNLCREWVSPVWAALLSALVFTSVHQEPSWFLPVLVLGYGLAMSYERSDRLLVPMTIHAGQNGLSFALIYLLLA